MSFRNLMQKMALYLGLAAFAIVAGLSYQRGVELLFSVLRGIGAFFAILFFQRTVCGFFDSWLASAEENVESAAEHSPAEMDTFSRSASIGEG